MSGFDDRQEHSRIDRTSGTIVRETGLLELADDSTGEPNDSFELREMVAAASAYLNQGLIADADELLREVLDAGYSRPDAADLQRRILEISIGDVRPEPEPDLVPSSGPTLVSFTSPLPGSDRLPADVQRLIRESDIDLMAGRIQAALDSAFVVIAKAADYYPMYVRLAEIQLSLGRREQATQLSATLAECIRVSASGQEWLLFPLQLALAPDNIETLVEYARHLLEHPGLVALEPFVPNAIEQMLVTDPAAAQELARDYFKALPLSDSALRMYIRTAVANQDRETLVNAIKNNVRADSSPDLLILRSAIGAARSREEWVDWLERAVSAPTTRSTERGHVLDALELTGRLLQPARSALTASIVNLATSRPEQVRDAVARWREATSARPIDRLDAFVVACADADAAVQLKSPDAMEASLAAVELAVQPDVASFAATCRLLGRDVGPEALVSRVIDVAGERDMEDEAIWRLQALRDKSPDAIEVREGLATLCLAKKRVAEGVRELRYVAERRDASGDIAGMVAAMRKISIALPTNAEAKSKIVEGYLQRGVLDEAVNELQLLGELQSNKGKRPEAVAAYSRGAEVAAAIGNLKRATELHESAVLVEPDSDAVRHAAVAFFLRIGAIDRAVRQLWEVVRIALANHDPDEAVAALHQIIALAPGDPAAYHKLGEVLASLGEYSQSEKVYRRLASITPDDPVLAAKQAALAALATPR